MEGFQFLEITITYHSNSQYPLLELMTRKQARVNRSILFRNWNMINIVNKD
ncbi:hypothetical protein BpHYR1_007980 [Brachionus plicatilis]|uniref:Uncharacterized protein n=1 Tax=Brachionus plicatilis TaxID=10195 RepID=A0A3M7QFD9_BRAPC|nr:hypothetical protein BpHYR1_007980 [Brachionus plicatilis]